MLKVITFFFVFNVEDIITLVVHLCRQRTYEMCLHKQNKEIVKLSNVFFLKEVLQFSVLYLDRKNFSLLLYNDSSCHIYFLFLFKAQTFFSKSEKKPSVISASATQGRLKRKHNLLWE